MTPNFRVRFPECTRKEKSLLTTAQNDYKAEKRCVKC